MLLTKLTRPSYTTEGRANPQSASIPFSTTTILTQVRRLHGRDVDGVHRREGLGRRNMRSDRRARSWARQPVGVAMPKFMLQVLALVLGPVDVWFRQQCRQYRSQATFDYVFASGC